MDHLDRFTDRAEAYAQHRPSYPEAMLDYLADYGLQPGAQVADVGSGTGILTRLLLDRGARVCAVEPNPSMRESAERSLAGYAGFTSVNGTADATGLPDSNVDLITAAQAFHWFEPQSTRAEWARIGRPGCWVALIWNERIDEGPFAEGFGALARAFVDRQASIARRRLTDPTADIAGFFAPNPVFTIEFPNHQSMTLDGVRGRALSSSYWPSSGPDYEESMRQLESLFDASNEEGLVRLDYRTEVFLGQVS